MVFSSGPGQSYVFSIFIDSIIEDTGLSRPGISALYMASTAMSAVLVAFVSRLADRYGPRTMLVAVGLGFGAACFGMAPRPGAKRCDVACLTRLGPPRTYASAATMLTLRRCRL